MILDLIRSQWKLILIGALLIACGMYRQALLSEEKEHAVDTALHQQLFKNAQAETQKAKNISDTALKEINNEIPKLVAAAQKNAVSNYQRLYGRPSSASSDSCIYLGSGINANGLRVDTSNSAGTVPSDSAESVKLDAVAVVDNGTCDSRFISEAAEAAVIIKGWNDWATMNQLPREK